MVEKQKNRLKNRVQQQWVEAGCDEAGRGCFAGPVFAAAVILPRRFHHPLLNDSKQLSASHREELKGYIEANALACAVAMANVQEIDKVNILKASQRAMHKALAALHIQAGFIAVDGNYFIPYPATPHRCIVKGDAIYKHIAAASILAKTYRDAYMLQLHQEYPQYGWDRNKGYGTALHRQAIAAHGLCIHHRKSFNIIPAQTVLF